MIVEFIGRVDRSLEARGSFAASTHLFCKEEKLALGNYRNVIKVLT
jgi:hypothetical protein